MADVNPQRRLPAPIETGKWYDIRLEVGPDKVECYLNDKLLMTYEEPSKLIGLAGKDTATGDLIVKMVNGHEEACTADIQLDGFEVASGDAYVLSAPALEVENSFLAPQQYVPVKTALGAKEKGFSYTFAPYSITVLRLKPVRR